jgi:sugar lactone lactonase YvrE
VANWGVKGSGGTQIHRITPEDELELFVSGQGIHTPIGLAFDAAGNLYAANAGDGKIHRITPDAKVELLATVPRAPVRFSLGHMVCVDDRLFVSGNFRHVIYEVSLAGEVSILAGADNQAGDVDGPLRDARFNIPNGLAVTPDGDSLWVVYGGGGPKRHLRRIRLPERASEGEAGEPDGSR